MDRRELTEDERRRNIEETFASWRLDGLLLTAEDVRLACAYISGEMTLDEILTETHARFSDPGLQPRA